MDGMNCKICGFRIVIKGISLVCTGCGNATRSNQIFSTEQDYQKLLLKRTTQHIKQKQDKLYINETISEHLKKNWLNYLQAFSKFIINLGKQLNIDVKPLYQKYLTQLLHQPIQSNWTIARKGHQEFSNFRIVNSKYQAQNQTNDTLIQIKVEDDMDLDFERQLSKNFHNEQLNQSSIQEIQNIKKKISKPKNTHYQKRILKQQLKLGHTLHSSNSKRKQSAQRKGSQILDFPSIQDKDEFFNNFLNQAILINSLYLAIVQVYYEKFYSIQQPDNLRNQIHKIKNITNQKIMRFIKIKTISQDIFNSMPSFLQMEYLLIQDILIFKLGKEHSFQEMCEQFEQELKNTSMSQNLKRNLKFLIRKITMIQKFINNQQQVQSQAQTQETDITVTINNKLFKKKQINLIPLDFTLGLVLIYASNLIQNKQLFPSKLITLIKQKKINYLEGFSNLMKEIPNQYLTIPQHIPKAKFIRENAVNLLKQLKLDYKNDDKEQLFELFKTICKDLNISNQLFNIAKSLEQKYLIQYDIEQSEFDIYCCSLILLGFKYYLYLDKENAIKDLLEIEKYCKNHQLYDYKDLECCELDNLRQNLSSQQRLSQYYGDRGVNEKLNEKLSQIDNFFDKQIIYEQHQQQYFEIENSIQIQIIHQDWDFYITNDFQNEAPELRFLEMKLCNYLEDEDNQIIIEFHKMVKYLV